MSANHGNDNRQYRVSNADLKNYRDIAPETVADEVLLDLIRKNGKNDAAIKEAIQAMWNEESTTVSANDWISTDKKKIKKKPEHSALSERGSGRGRGRSAPPSRGHEGRGGAGGRGSGGRSSSVASNGRSSAPARKPEDPSINSTNGWGTDPAPQSNTADDTIIDTAIATESSDSQPEVPSPTPSAPPLVTKAPAWGAGASLAQKLRDAEAAKNAPPPEPEKPKEAPAGVPTRRQGSPRESGGRGRGGRGRKGQRDTPQETETRNVVDDTQPAPTETSAITVSDEPSSSDAAALISGVHNISLPQDDDQSRPLVSVDVVAPLVDTAAPELPHLVLLTPRRASAEPAAASAASPLLKMGKWEANLDSSDTSFQFGSFGNFGSESARPEGDESPHKIASGLISSSLGMADAQSVGWGQPAPGLESEPAPNSDINIPVTSAPSVSVWGGSSSQQQESGSENNLYGNFDQRHTPSASVNTNAGNDQIQQEEFVDSAPQNISAPPGLGLLGGLDSSVSSSAAVSSQVSSGKGSGGNNRAQGTRSAPGSRKNEVEGKQVQQQAPQSQYYQQASSAQAPPPPPGIQPQPVGPFSVPQYGYGFEASPSPSLQQTQPSPPGGYGIPSNAVPASSSGGVAAPPASTSPQAAAPAPQGNVVPAAASNSYSATQGGGVPMNKYPGPPGMQAQMGAPPFHPYYGNPYYHQQAFYYGGQPQNYYGRGGQGLYQPPRGPYGADPYATPAMGGYDMYGQGAQFGDSMYGQMPMPHMHAPQGAAGGAGGDNRQGSGKGGKGSANSAQQANGGSVPAGSQPDPMQQGSYGVPGAYNQHGYGRADPAAGGWPPYQGWGNQMMPFPSNSGGMGVGGGYSQMGGVPPQGGRHENSSRGGGGSYGQSYGGRGGGAPGAEASGANLGSSATGAGTTSNW